MKTTLFVSVTDHSGLRSLQRGDEFLGYHPDPGNAIPVEIDLDEYVLCRMENDYSVGRPVIRLSVKPKPKVRQPEKFEEV